jgi:hypothetical protein
VLPFSDCTGHREREAGAAPGGYRGKVQCGLELPAGEEQPTRMLSVPGRAQELLLLQGDPQGRVHCRKSFYARQVCYHGLPGGASCGGHANEGHLLQHFQQALAPCCWLLARL